MSAMQNYLFLVLYKIIKVFSLVLRWIVVSNLICTKMRNSILRVTKIKF